MLYVCFRGRALALGGGLTALWPDQFNYPWGFHSWGDLLVALLCLAGQSLALGCGLMALLPRFRQFPWRFRVFASGLLPAATNVFMLWLGLLPSWNASHTVLRLLLMGPLLVAACIQVCALASVWHTRRLPGGRKWGYSALCGCMLLATVWSVLVLWTLSQEVTFPPD